MDKTMVASELVKLAKELVAKPVTAALWDQVAIKFGEKLAVQTFSTMLKQAANYAGDDRLNPDGKLWVNEIMPAIREGFNRELTRQCRDY